MLASCSRNRLSMQGSCKSKAQGQQALGIAPLEVVCINGDVDCVFEVGQHAVSFALVIFVLVEPVKAMDIGYIYH